MDENNNGNNQMPNEPFSERPDSFSQPPPGYGYMPMPPEPEMSVKDWLITLLILAIPCVNIIMMFVWAFSSNGYRTRSNFCKAQLIFLAISIVIGIALSGFIGSILALVLREMRYMY